MCVGGGGVKVGVCFIQREVPGQESDPTVLWLLMLPTFARFAYRVGQEHPPEWTGGCFACISSFCASPLWCWELWFTPGVLFAVVPFHTVWRGCPFPLLSLVAPALCDPPLWRRRRAAGCATQLTRHDAARDSGGWGDRPEDCTPRHTTHACGGGSCMGQLSSLCWCLLQGAVQRLTALAHVCLCLISSLPCSTLLKLCQPLAGAELNAARHLENLTAYFPHHSDV